jgi:hypothetical protein
MENVCLEISTLPHHPLFLLSKNNWRPSFSCIDDKDTFLYILEYKLYNLATDTEMIIYAQHCQLCGSE